MEKIRGQQSDYRRGMVQWVSQVGKCLKDPYTMALVQERVKRDPYYFFNHWLWTYDPRTKYKLLPFRLFGFQEKLIEDLIYAYENKEPLLVEKSRDMGFSWVFLGFCLWKCLSEKNFSAGIGSRKAQLVDELGNMKSLLQRFRFMLNLLPEFLRGGYIEKKNSKLGLVEIPNTSAYISGEAGDGIGRGDRTSIYILDEFAHIPRSAIVQAAVSQTSDCIVYGSTPNGKGNEFARLRFKTKIKRATLHWKDHPNKDQAWYEKQKELLDEETIAQELDISYSKSQKGRVHKWFDASKHANESVKYNPNYPVITTFDWGIGDPTACLFIQDYGGTVHIFNNFEKADSEISIIFNMVSNNLQKDNCTFSNVCGWYGDPDGRNRNIVSGESIASFIKDKYGIILRYKLPNVIKNRIMAVRMLGQHGRIKVDKDLHHVIDCFENYRYPDKDSSENEKPIHDWTSHTMSALEYYCVYEHGLDQYEVNNLYITQTGFR